jgi:hypothetical protein
MHDLILLLLAICLLVYPGNATLGGGLRRRLEGMPSSPPTTLLEFLRDDSLYNQTAGMFYMRSYCDIDDVFVPHCFSL